MAWISTRELRRLERELTNAVKRANDAEERLQSERASKDWMIQQLTSRFVTKQGLYGLDNQPTPLAPTPAHPKGFLRDPTPEDEAKLEYYIRCAINADIPNPEEDATMRWEAEMRGESILYSEQDQ